MEEFNSVLYICVHPKCTDIDISLTMKHTGQITKVWLSYHMVLISFDSKTRWQDNGTFMAKLHWSNSLTSLYSFEWDRISKLQKRALRIMTNSRYNAHTEPLFKQLHLLKVKDIFDVQCLKFWYKFVNNELPNYFRNMFTYNHELHDFETRNRDRLHYIKPAPVEHVMF